MLWLMTPDSGLCGPTAGVSVWPSLGMKTGLLPRDDRLKAQLICTCPFLREGPRNGSHGRTQAVLPGGDPFVKNVLANFSAAKIKHHDQGLFGLAGGAGS